MFKKISLEEAILFYTGREYIPSTNYLKKVSAFKDSKKSKWFNIEWIYFLANTLEDAKGRTSSSFLQRLNWITTDTVWDSFIEYRQTQQKLIPNILKNGRELIELSQSMYSNPDITKLAISELLIWDIKLSEGVQYEPKNLVPLVSLALGNREYGSLLFVKEYITNKIGK